MREEQERLKKLLHDTVSMLCRNSVVYEHGLRIEGIIGITVDDNDVFLIHIDDTFGESRDSVSRDTGYCQNIKSEPGYTEDIGKSRPQPVMMHGYQMPYTHSSSSAAAAASAAGNEHISSTVVTESIVIKTDNMAGDEGQWGGAYEDSYSGLAYPSMDPNPYMSSSDGFYQQPSVAQHHSQPRMPGTSRGRAGRTAGRGRAPRGRAPRGRAKPATASGPDDWPSRPQSAAAGSNQFVITESTHLCGYPDCGKRFRFKHDLLRHQTKYHGREPVKAKRKSSVQPFPESVMDDDMTDYYYDE